MMRDALAQHVQTGGADVRDRPPSRLNAPRGLEVCFRRRRRRLSANSGGWVGSKAHAGADAGVYVIGDQSVAPTASGEGAGPRPEGGREVFCGPAPA